MPAATQIRTRGEACGKLTQAQIIKARKNSSGVSVVISTDDSWMPGIRMKIAAATRPIQLPFAPWPPYSRAAMRRDHQGRAGADQGEPMRSQASASPPIRVVAQISQAITGGLEK